MGFTQRKGFAMRKLATHTLYIALTIWAQTGGPVDQSVIDLGFLAYDFWEKGRSDRG